MLVARNKACQQLLQLILKCLKHPGPNLSHYLLGFNLRKPISTTEIQDPGKGFFFSYFLYCMYFNSWNN